MQKDPTKIRIYGTPEGALYIRPEELFARKDVQEMIKKANKIKLRRDYNVSKNFILQEFINKEIYTAWGENSIWFIDKRIITIAQFIRDRFDHVVTINNWHTGGQYNLSGLRPFNTTTGSGLSQHKFGRAIDVKLIGKINNGADEMRDDIINHFDEYRAIGLTTIEDKEYAPTWCHIDCRWTNMNTLKIVKP